VGNRRLALGKHFANCLLIDQSAPELMEMLRITYEMQLLCEKRTFEQKFKKATNAIFDLGQLLSLP
jgi:hypothetical protein